MNFKNITLSMQHVFAMFGACVLIPMLMGVPVELGLLGAGVGTLLYHFVTGGKVPLFLGSSASYLSTFILLRETMGINVAVGSIVGASITFFIVGWLVKLIGIDLVNKLLPRTLAGSIVIVIGIILVPIALMLASSNFPIAIMSAIILIIFCSLNKTVFRLFPVILSIIVSYTICIFLGLVDFKPVLEASWFTMPRFINPEYNVNAIIIMSIVAIVSMLEHVADLTTNGLIVGKDHFKETGLHRSLWGNGVALLFAGLTGTSPQTSYGENNGTLALTKVYNPAILRGAGVIAIILAFLGKLSAVLSTIPMPVIGGISFILFGMIAMSGMSAIKESNVNIMEFRHAVVIFLPIFIGVASILPDNPLKIVVNEYLVLSGLSLSALVGIVLNLLMNTIFKEEQY